MLKLSKTCVQLINKSLNRNVSCTPKLQLDQKWREDQGLPANPNEFGPLTNLPDYTYLDGRPTPMGSNQKKRLIRQQEIASKIVAMSQELEQGKERYTRLQKQEQLEKQKIMQAKLKPKGKFMFEQKK